MRAAEHPEDTRLRTVGGYDLHEKIVRSRTSTLYRGVHTLLKREALVMVLSAEARKRPETERRFLREIKLMGRLSHPNLLTTLHAGKDQDRYYLVLENVQGIDLRAMVKEQGPLGVEQAVQWIIQAADGLAFLHQHGIVHRNVKPRNLLVDAAKQIRIINLTDALASVEAPLTLDEQKLTRTGQVLGTAEFLSPEQAFDSHSVDARSDIYSLGCTLFYLLTAEFPYPAGATGHQRAIAHVQQPIPSLCDKRDDISPAVDAAFQKMLAKMPVDRYQTMEDAADGLRQALKGTHSGERVNWSMPTNWSHVAWIGGAGIVLGALIQAGLQYLWI